MAIAIKSMHSLCSELAVTIHVLRWSIAIALVDVRGRTC